MSGHSKWANIKRRKGASDAVRGKIFTKIGRELAVAVKMGGADPDSNSRLRDIIAKAKAANMPNDNIARSIKKASGELGSINYEEITYEGYGAGGVAVIVNSLTDNKVRTVGEVRHIFDKYGGSMGTNGCVSFMFDIRGVILISKTEESDDDEMMIAALDAGADDFNVIDGVYEITTTPADFSRVREALETKGYAFLKAELDRIPQNVVVPEGENLEKLLKMLDKFDENDDVQSVFHNAELPETDDEE